jgi:hypothetical protein
MNETLRKIVDCGLRAWLNWDVDLADSVGMAIESAGLLGPDALSRYHGCCEDFAITGQARSNGLTTNPIDEAALAQDVARITADAEAKLGEVDAANI